MFNLIPFWSFDQAKRPRKLHSHNTGHIAQPEDHSCGKNSPVARKKNRENFLVSLGVLWYYKWLDFIGRLKGKLVDNLEGLWLGWTHQGALHWPFMSGSCWNSQQPLSEGDAFKCIRKMPGFPEVSQFLPPEIGSGFDTPNLTDWTNDPRSAPSFPGHLKSRAAAMMLVSDHGQSLHSQTKKKVQCFPK